MRFGPFGNGRAVSLRCFLLDYLVAARYSLPFTGSGSRDKLLCMFFDYKMLRVLTAIHGVG